ncbi:hypothetical protein BVG19_g5575 [[Candida] boidinii]|nr:hypothetical protein BVG19_g5575 [[Candida] boidinii]OWB53098.1 hypothetical protein B5S27_g4686 [[Candida] boidinii]
MSQQAKNSNRIILLVAAAAAGYYFYDCNYNNGRTVGQFGLPNYLGSQQQEAQSVVQGAFQKADDLKSSSSNWINEKAQKVSDGSIDLKNSVLDQLDKGKEQALKAYYQAGDNVKAAEKNLHDASKSWLNWGDDKKEEAKSEYQSKIDLAKAQYEDTKKTLSQWGSDFVNQAEANKEKFSNALNHKLNDVDVSRTAADAVSGWGETAKIVAEEQYESLFDKNGKLSVASKESAQKVADYYNEKVKEAKKQYDSTQSSWLKWRSAKSKEVQDASKEQYEALLKRQKESQESFEKISKKAIDSAKDNLDSAHSNAQSWLTSLSNWIRGK